MAPRFKQRFAAIRECVATGTWSDDPAGKRRLQFLRRVDQLISQSNGVAYLIAAATNTNRSRKQREAAIWMLGRLKAKTAMRPLLTLMRGSDQQLSYVATNALCDLEDERAVPTLLRVLAASPHWWSREGAAWALWKVTGPGAAAALAHAAVEDSSGAVRRSAVHGLITDPCKSTFVALAKALDDPAPVVRSIAVFAAGCLSQKRGSHLVVPALKSYLSKWSHRADEIEDGQDMIDSIIARSSRP